MGQHVNTSLGLPGERGPECADPECGCHADEETLSRRYTARRYLEPGVLELTPEESAAFWRSVARGDRQPFDLEEVRTVYAFGGDAVLESRTPDINVWAGAGVVALHCHPAGDPCDDCCTEHTL